MKTILVKRNVTSNVHGVPLLLHGEVSFPLVELHEVPRALGPGRDGCVLRVVRQHLCTDTVKRRRIGKGTGKRKDIKKSQSQRGFLSYDLL